MSAAAGRVLVEKSVGAHVSIAGGLFQAPLRARSLGCASFGLFLSSNRSWKICETPLPASAVSSFLETCSACGYDPARDVLPHSNYLINLGSPEADKLAKSRAAFLREMTRCEQLGIRFLNFHPGSSVGLSTREQCLRTVSQSLEWVFNQTPNSHVMAVIENTAGAGNTVGSTLEDIAAIIEGVGSEFHRRRVGVCIDTCHAFAAGYDLRTSQGLASFIQKFDSIIGLDFWCAWHLNDSKGGLGSHLDRHEHLGKGQLGLSAFRAIMNSGEARFAGMPMIIETDDPSLDFATANSLKGDAGSDQDAGAGVGPLFPSFSSSSSFSTSSSAASAKRKSSKKEKSVAKDTKRKREASSSSSSSAVIDLTSSPPSSPTSSYSSSSSPTSSSSWKKGPKSKTTKKRR